MNSVVTDNSIIVWNGLPEIKEVKVETETQSGIQIEFTHPGIFAKKENLDLMRKMIHEGYDPWFSAFEQFRKSALAGKEYVNTNIKRTHAYIGNADRQDANAAYMQSVMWWVTGDKAYYDIAIDIIRSYCHSYDPARFEKEQNGGYGWEADIITTGMVINKLSFAAELFRYADTIDPITGRPYDNAWNQRDTERFTEVLKMSYPLYDRTDKWMNQTAFTFQAMIASAVFQSDPDMYECVIERATVNNKALFHFSDASIKWQARMVDVTVSIEDSGNDDNEPALIKVEEPVIQWAEMGRDQPHAQAGLALMSAVAQTAYIQGTEVDRNGSIVKSGEGTNLFRFLDNRLLKGANYYYQYNLGYDVKWYPLAKGDASDYTECPFGTGSSDNDRGWWTTVSPANRFRLGGSGVLYYYYLYEEKLSEDDPDFKYVAEAQKRQDDTDGSGDAITNASLLIAPKAARLGIAHGSPLNKERAGYSVNIAGSGRIQAASYTGAYASRMEDKSTASSEYYSDALGARVVINNNYMGDYTWYKDVDLGKTEIDSFILTSASNSTNGTLFRLILLDDVEVADWKQVTRAELDQGEVLVEGFSGGTGWWTKYETKVFLMSRKLCGRHSYAFLYLGSSNVYQLAANVDWMAFGNYYAYQINLVKDAPIKKDAVVIKSKVCLKSGAIFGWNLMDMDIGNSGLRMDICSTGTGTLALYCGDPDDKGKLTAVYPIPCTNGRFMAVSIAGSYKAVIKGNQDIYYLYKGNSDLVISSICSIRI